MSDQALIELAERPQLLPPAEARRLRQHLGVQVRELANAIGVHPVTLSKWEAGIQRPTGPRAVTYAHALALLAKGEARTQGNGP